MVLVYFHFFKDYEIQVIDPRHYVDHHKWPKILINKNPKIVFGLYISEGAAPSSILFKPQWFEPTLDPNNVKYFSWSRIYLDENFIKGGDSSRKNASDGFGMIKTLLELNFSNLSILGFTAFGSDEDMYYHTKYRGRDIRFAGRKYFDLDTSEDLPTESNILKHWIDTGKIKNIEDHNTLISYLK